MSIGTPSPVTRADGVSVSSVATTVPFNVPTDTLLVACVSANSSSTGVTASTVTDSSGLVWSLRVSAAYSAGLPNGYCAIWTAPCPAGATGITVTATTTGSTSTTRRPSLKVYRVPGVDLANPIVSSGTGQSTTDAVAFSFTSTVRNSLLIAVTSDWQKRGAPTSPDLTYDGFDQAGADGVSGLFGYRQLGAPGPQTYTVDGPGVATAAWRVARVELRPSPGVQLLPEIPAGRVAVEIAWGADLTDTDGSGWTWTDVTEDVRVSDGITGTLGRNDEASTSQPATVALTLDNALGRYSLGGQSPNYPNVRRNVPVRVRVEPTPVAGYSVLFQGYAVGFTPSWDVATGRIPVAKLEAAGVLRRLAQGTDPLRSALYRHHTLATNPAEYWPLEEDKTALSGISATGGAPALLEVLSSGGVNYGKVAWGGDTDNPATERAVQVSAGGGVLCAIDTTAYTGNYWAVSWSMKYSSKSGAFTKFATDDLVTNTRYHATWYTDGSMDMTLITDQSVAFNILSTPAYDNYLWDEVWHSYVMTVDYTATACVHRFYRDGVLLSTNTATPGYRQRPRLLRFQSAAAPSGTEDPVAVAHVAVWRSALTVADVTAAASAHTGEAASARLTRLCAQQGVDIAITGTTTALMGPQRPLAFLALLRECEDADLGILYDGIGPGLAYLARDQRENADVDVALAATDLVMPFQPVDDDQRTVNRATSTGRSGAKYTAEDTTGPMGTAVIGVYDSSSDVNLATDGEVPSYADWAVHLGTVEGYRYPSVTIDLKARPSLAATVLALAPSARLVVTGVGTTMAAMPKGDVDLLVEGLAWTLNTITWSATAKCSPYGPWVVGELASTTGDTDPEVIRLLPDGSTLGAGYAAGATSISVATPSGPLWSTASDDYPVTLDVGGVPVTASACSGASSPQTFTVAALTTARSSGTSVSVWNPPVLGL